MLESLIAASPDGRYRAYLADVGAVGGLWADVVLLDTATGEIVFLTDQMPSGWVPQLGGGTFGHESLLLLNYWNHMRFFDARTARESSFSLPFAYEQDGKSYTTVGVAFDAEAGLYLVAYREGAGVLLGYDTREAIWLNVYDTTGRILSSTNTGLTVDVWYRVYFNPLGLELDGTGQVTFTAFQAGYMNPVVEVGVYRYRD
jgi:hypothetical protein